MFGISAGRKDAIGNHVEDIFDNIALEFIGEIPKLKNRKLLIINTKQNYSLGHLFVQSMANKKPNEIEQDALKSLLSSSHGYIESLKNRTRNSITEKLDALVKEASARKEKPTQEQIDTILREELGKARASMLAIVEAESTKVRNFGSMMDISRIASTAGDNDPSVFFVVVKDASTCKECIRLHLMPDQVTPRVWKFSELKQGYHKRGDDSPCTSGLHPFCRCTLTYLGKGYGFDEKGYTQYKSQNHDQHSSQKK